jgi:hypothetical protein
MDDRNYPFYIFTDVAGLFWPDNYGKSNHDATERVQTKLIEKGCKVAKVMRVVWSTTYKYEGFLTPHGYVGFDSEAGTFECHGAKREAVEFVAEVIDEMVAELDAHREALR